MRRLSFVTEQRSASSGLDWRAMTPEDSPKTPVDLMADPSVVDLAQAKCAVGDVAPDFELPVFDFSVGTEQPTGRSMRLSAVAAERPVALIFGSYT